MPRLFYQQQAKEESETRKVLMPGFRCLEFFSLSSGRRRPTLCGSARFDLAFSTPRQKALFLSKTQRHALRRSRRQRHSGVRLRATEHREERERRDGKKEKKKKSVKMQKPVGSPPFSLLSSSSSTSTSSGASFSSPQNRLRPTAAAASAASAPSSSAAAASAKAKPPSFFSSVDWRFVARHLPWLQSLAVVALTVVPLIVLEAAGKPRQRPFDVYDASISYSYRQDTVPALVAFFVPVFVWLVTAAAVEVAAASKRAKRSPSSAAAASSAAALAVLYHTFDVASCLLFTALVTEATKLGVGRLRPYFLSACSPADPAMAATLAIGDARPPCDPVAGIAQRNARVSFPSGHASTSMCTCAFAAFYVVWAVVLREEEEEGEKNAEERGEDAADDDREAQRSCSSAAKRFFDLRNNNNGDFLRFVALLWALVLVGSPWVIGATRIVDNRHHPSDVVAGLGLGLVVAGLFFARSVGGRRALPGYSAAAGGRKGVPSSSSSSAAAKRGGGGGRRSSEAEALV